MSATTKYKLLSTVVLVISVFCVNGQENSPYSRYGLGDIVPNQSILNRGMGGIAAGYVDYDKRYDLKGFYPKSQTVNFLNPASYSKMRITSFDLGFEVDNRVLRTPATGEKFAAASAIISYLQLGVPLSRKHELGLNIGLRPVSRINYKIQKIEQLAGVDTSLSLFNGSGGSYEVFAGLGKGFKNFSVGVNLGYYFGTKDYSTRKQFLNDTVTYFKSNHETKSSFGGILVNFGLQYAAQLNEKTKLTLGAYGNLRQKFNGSQDIIRETFDYDVNGGVYRVDSVLVSSDVSGKIQYPSNVGFGFVIERQDRWLIGIDYTTTKWEDYRFFGESDLVRNSWMVKVGGQLTPDPAKAKNYFGRISYRAGFNFGPDYIKVANQDLSQLGFSLGAGFPIRKNPYTNQYSFINLGIEYGKRGNNDNLLKENILRISLGFTLSDLWFIKKKYD
ncbi:MAG: hypothetical protein H7Y27_07320 [Gemmatimonadaceae bacterium]|nr:hypothetical protein [Chitinophagaceae bacterium]